MSIDCVEALYTQNLNEFGICSKSVGWPDENDHILRFAKLIGNLIAGDVNSVNDLGSGYGAILEYFKSKDINLQSYFAYDISQGMLDSIDIQKYNDVNIHKFCSSEITTIADYSVASGIFNVRLSESESSWHEHIMKTLCNINAHSLKGFSFNSLSTYVDFKRDHLYYGDPLIFFDYCKKHFSRHVSLIHDYNLWEWTIVVKKI